MKCLLALLLLSPAFHLWSQEVGQGAPLAVEQRFLNAFFRNRFNALTSLPAIANARTFGGTGYIQEFPDASGDRGNRFALVTATAGAAEAYQLYPGLNAYYQSVGVNNAGFPSMDTGGCTTLADGNACAYQIFDKNYALFVYGPSSLRSVISAQYTVKPPFFQRWSQLGSITGLGPAASAETNITSTTTGITAVNQLFVSGALYSITSGAATGRVYGVTGKVFTLYSSLALHTGSLGLPTSDELNAGSGRFRQNFEGGSIEYTATTDAVVRPAVGSVGLSISTNQVTRMNLGDTLAIRATVLATVGGELTDRPVTWITSNSRVVAITANGSQATLRAVGGGTAAIQAVSDGKLSPPLTIFVAAPCCQIGEGAPNTAIAQAFTDAVVRNRINVRLPAANPVRRSGLGYVQDLQTADTPSVRFLLCRSDRSPGVFVVTGELLRGWEAEGGPIGRLAYPTADANASGRQNFEGGVLAGNPVQAVTGRILDLWANTGYELGPLGTPSGSPASALSFTGALGSGQPFAFGYVYSIETGTFAGKSFVVSGLILAKYGSMGGPLGRLGYPVSDEYGDAGRRRQDFEGGSFLYTPGEEEPELQELERRPSVTITPGRVAAGARVRVAVGGFTPNTPVQVTLVGTVTIPSFTFQSETGSYAWDLPIATGIRTGTVTVTAMEGDRRSSGSFSVTALSEASLQLIKLRGDTQTGLPGARAANPLAIGLRDEQGNPVAGVPVRFNSSPGATILTAATTTDERGEASATVRLQNTDGIVLVTAEAAGRVTTFSLRASGSSLAGFPRQTYGGTFTLGASTVPVAQKGALLAAVSSVIRYFQNRSEIPSSQGLSDPAVLNEFLRNYCVLDTGGGRICDGYLTPAGPGEPVVNLWRLREFAGNSVDVEILPGEDNGIRDALAAGAPLILVLGMTAGETPAGVHYVVATGVGADGSLLIQDPSPLFNRTRLADYTTGIPAGGRTWRAEILQAIRLWPRSSSPTGFLIESASAAISVRSPLGDCGADLRLPAAAVFDAQQLPSAQTSSLYYCAGQSIEFAAGFSASGAFRAALTDLSSPGRREQISSGGPDGAAIVRSNAQWQFARLEAKANTAGIVNAATQTAEIAPGSLVTVSGSGLSGASFPTVADVGGLEARIQSANEFRLNIEIPSDAQPGGQMLRIQSPHGVLDLPITLSPVAPAIFRDQQTGRPVIVNAGGAPNSQTEPANRGSVITIYATGLGQTVAQGRNQVTVQPVRAVIQGVEVTPSFAGRAEGLPGVYIVNVSLPQTLPPGLAVPLFLRQSGVESNTVSLAIR
ncbi:MAG: Ig-like domain-containing protein [Bryobacterales bacterium]|nr:Ig-like domain-containing protein [Bryobacterales bacterium]